MNNVEQLRRDAILGPDGPSHTADFKGVDFAAVSFTIGKPLIVIVRDEEIKEAS